LAARSIGGRFDALHRIPGDEEGEATGDQRGIDRPEGARLQ
jgi:hypothetical protein